MPTAEALTVHGLKRRVASQLAKHDSEVTVTAWAGKGSEP